MCCYNKPNGGGVYLEETNLNKLKTRDIATKIATVHQENEAPGDVTVETLISYGRSPHSKQNRKDDEEIIDWAIKSTNLDEIRNKKVMSLSGGQRQRAFIAMSLAQKTDILLLDEPTTYLDIYHQIEILEMVKELNEKYGITIIMVLHDINQAIKYSDNIVIMKNGTLIKSGKPEEILNENTIKEVYQVEGMICNHGDETYFVPKSAC